LTDPHPIVDALRNQPGRLPAFPTNRSRALLLLESLVREAQRRGYVVYGARASASTLLSIEVARQQYTVTVYEQTGARWTLRLCLNIHGPGQGRDLWTDYVRRPVEVELSAILDEIARRATEITAEQERRQRAEAERQERERQRQITEHRAQVIREQVTAWRLAEDIRHHCAELVAAGLPRGDGWLRWAGDYADSLDPTLDPPGFPPRLPRRNWRDNVASSGPSSSVAIGERWTCRGRGIRTGAGGIGSSLLTRRDTAADPPSPVRGRSAWRPGCGAGRCYPRTARPTRPRPARPRVGPRVRSTRSRSARL